MKIKIKFPDGNIKEYERGTSALEIAESISHGLADQTVTARINGRLVDIDYPIGDDASLELLKFDSDEGREVYWHSTAHLMAQAVQQLFPEVKVTIGPAIESGFYYDFDKPVPFTDEDLATIEQRMKEMAKNNYEYHREEISRDEAMKMFDEMGETYKLEILAEIPENETISLYRQGDFVDLCRGPHIIHTGRIKAIKLLKTSGAYWRGDSRNKMLQRIYGISFPSSKQLKVHLNNLEEAKKRDHRRIGIDLDLYSINEEIGPGLVLWHPNGAMIRNIIEDFWKKEHLKAGYKLVYTPHIGKKHLWETSGHLGFYYESMFAPIEVEGQDYYLKPMNCPFHLAIYNSQKRSYRELPLRLAELGTVYRYEKSGALHGLMRVRGFTQDDAHLICTAEQVEPEVEKLIRFSFMMLNSFGFENYQVYLSTKPEKAVGEDKEWELATESLKKALEKQKIDYIVDEGGGAFYGPKIDIKIKDALNRSWQCTTIQFDFNLPSRFEMEYTGSDNSPHRPYVLHRALLGSVERFFGTLIEYHGGNFPLWLCPVQVKILPISDNFMEYAQKLESELLQHMIRAEIDYRNEKIGFKIRNAELQKTPYMFIVGAKEVERGEVSIRRHTEGDIGTFNIADAIKRLQEELQKK
jgi:threonyl-tRNA synthetase